MPNPYKQLAYSKRVIVNLKTGIAFRGYLSEVRGILIELKAAELLEPGSDPVEMTGSVLIERNNVDFIQALEV